MAEGSYSNPRRVTIWWFKPIPYSELSYWQDDYYEVLYFIYRGKGKQWRTRYYVGQAYSQDIVKRLKNPGHKIHQIIRDEGESGLRISFGELRLKENRKISLGLVDDIERLLIYAYAPKYNVSGIWKYAGRHLVIKNMGRCSFFERTVDSRHYFEE